ncbi:MAG: ATP-dependent DNA helicase [Nitrososphaeria archaeon]
MATTPFPYRYREYQRDFLEFVRDNVKEKNLVINAVTGFGKTPLILSALLPQAIEEKRKIIWVVRTGNEIDRPIEELGTITKSTGMEVFGLSFRGKRDMCLLLNDLKIKGRIDYEDAKYICDMNRDGCKYYNNLMEKKIKAPIHPMFYSEILSLCVQRQLCPYYFQIRLLPYSALVSLSYNYILDTRVRRVVQEGLDLKNAFLVIDEAHNLQQASILLNSDYMSELSIVKALKEERDFIKNKKIRWFLKAVLSYVRSEARDILDDKEFNFKDFLEAITDEYEFLKMTKQLMKAGSIVKEKKYMNNQAPRSSLNHIGEFLYRSYQSLKVDGIVFVLSLDKREKIKLELVDMRTNEILSDIWSLSYRNIFCSGTINPTDDFAKVIGLDNYISKSFPSIFDAKNAISMVTPTLSTEGIEFKDEMAQAYIRAIDSFIGSLDENLAVFSSSYRIQDSLIRNGLKDVIRYHGRRLFVEEQDMSGKRGREMLDQFKACAGTNTKGVLCATIGGRFAEGADFPGKELEGVFLVGVPFERLTTKTRKYIAYFQKIYGAREGKYYAYVLPALKKASQALGRALRSKEDRAVFVLGDKRYERFLNLLPDLVMKKYEKVYDCSQLSSVTSKYYSN